MKIVIKIIFLSLLLNACANNSIKVVKKPEKAITLEQAFKSVGKSLRVLDEATGDRMFGIAASEITVTFNISSTASDNQGVNISTPKLGNSTQTGTPASYASGREGNNSSTSLGENSLSAHSAIKGERKNQVTVKFESILKLLQNLDMKKIKLLKEMGYFGTTKKTVKSNEIVFNGNKMIMKERK